MFNIRDKVTILHNRHTGKIGRVTGVSTRYNPSGSVARKYSIKVDRTDYKREVVVMHERYLELYESAGVDNLIDWMEGCE